MGLKSILVTSILFLLFCLPSIRFNRFEVEAPNGYPVHNLNTGLNYTTIQDAIDASETLDGHVIFVESGTYIENVTIDKSISLIGEDVNSTIIDGNYRAFAAVNITSNNVALCGFTIQNSERYGIHVSSSYNNIKGNIIENNHIGIRLYSSNYSTISENKIRKSDWGIHLFFSNCNNVSDNTFNGTHGILIDGDYNMISKENVISHNNINSTWIGIYLHMSSHNQVIENTVFGDRCIYGINVEYSPSNAFINNTIRTGKSGITSGFLIWPHSENNLIHHNMILGFHMTHPTDYSVGIKVQDYNITITENHLINNTYGALIGGSGNTISRNIIIDNDIGLALDNSPNSLVLENTISRNEWGMKLNGEDSKICRNQVTDNYHIGISIESSGLTLRNNTIANNKYNFGVIGNNYYNDVDPSNTVDGKPVCYWVNKHNMTVPPDIGYLAIINSTSITVTGLVIRGNIQGILIANTLNSTVTRSNAIDNMFGIQLYYASNNKIMANNITDNEVGIMAHFSIANLIYHNYFINNKNQTQIEDPFWLNITNFWDNGYPLPEGGGNYWSDYTDIDLKSGPYQNQPGSDGIWDHPYVIDEKNQDNYPLVTEFPSFLIPQLFMATILLATLMWRRKNRGQLHKNL